MRERPHTKTISRAQINGSHSHWRLGVLPNKKASTNNNPIWISRWTQLESTAASGMISRGAGTRLINPALSTRDVVPEIQAIVKKLNGTRPHITNRPKFGTL